MQGHTIQTVSKEADLSGPVFNRETPPAAYDDRRREWTEFVLRQDPSELSCFDQLTRLQAGLPIDENPIFDTLTRLQRVEGTSDLPAILRLLHQFPDSPHVSGKLLEACRETVLGFNYWADEPGIYSRAMWTENHFMLYASGAILAGQLFPDTVFPASGETGREKIAKFTPRLETWLNLRYATGFSEFLSNVYYALHSFGLANIIDFIESPRLKTKAQMVLDTLLLDMALNHFQGGFAAASGRTYFKNKHDFQDHNTRSMIRLLFGQGDFSDKRRAANILALSSYEPPAALVELARDNQRESTVMQRMGWRVEEGARYGLDSHSLEDGMAFLTTESYTHPRIINQFIRMLDAYNWWENGILKAFKPFKKTLRILAKLGILSPLAGLVRKDLTRNYRPTVNVYSRRTADYMLSTAQDYRKGFGGDQHQIWQATLSPTAIVYATHPAREDVRGNDTPDLWTGSGNLPRAAQWGSVVISRFRISTLPGLYLTHRLKYTHAWFPRDAFDEVVERRGWIFGRYRNGYVALWSRQPMEWQTEGEFAGKELIARGKRNTWICELGSEVECGSFGEFVEKISGAGISFTGLTRKIRYDSPCNGMMEFGWTGSLKVKGKNVPLKDYPRYGGHGIHEEYPLQKLEIRSRGWRLIHDWVNLKRSEMREGS